MVRRLIVIFIFAFFLNLFWEHLHSVLYVSYQGGAMNSLLFVRCALFDASIITLFAWALLLIPPLLKEGGRAFETEDLNPSTSKTRLSTTIPVLPLGKAYSRRLEESRLPLFLLVLILFIFAILLEKYALATGRWVYADAMPIVPLLSVGLTPVIELPLTGYITLKILGFFTPRPR